MRAIWRYVGPIKSAKKLFLVEIGSRLGLAFPNMAGPASSHMLVSIVKASPVAAITEKRLMLGHNQAWSTKFPFFRAEPQDWRKSFAHAWGLSLAAVTKREVKTIG